MKVKRLPLHTRFNPGQVLKHEVESDYVQILECLSGGYIVKFYSEKNKFKASIRNWPKLHVHRHYGLAELNTRIKLIIGLYGE